MTLGGPGHVPRLVKWIIEGETECEILTTQKRVYLPQAKKRGEKNVVYGVFEEQRQVQFHWGKARDKWMGWDKIGEVKSGQ